MSSTQQAAPSLARDTRTMAIASAVSRITGFVRTLVLAAAIGLAAVGDAYNTANTLPNIVYELLIGGVLTSVIVPLLVHARAKDGDGGEAYTQRLMTLLIVVLGAATVLAVLAAPLLTYLYGIRDDPGQVALVNFLARILLVEIVFYGVGAMLGAILNSRGIFGPPAWAPVLNNVVVIATGVLFILSSGPGRLTPLTISTAQQWLLGIGTTLGIVVQAVVLVPALRRTGLRWRWRFDWRHTGLAEAGRLGAWVLGYVAISQVGFAVITAIANAAGRRSDIGSNAYANASLLFQMPYGILGVALLTALLPRMSRAAARNDVPALLGDLSLGTRWNSLALLPITAALMAVGPLIGTVALSRGEVTPEQASAVGTVLALSAFGLVPFAVVMLQLRVFYALKDGRTPTLINLIMVAVRVPLCLLCPALLAPEHIVAGLAVSNSVSFLVGAVVGQVWLHRRFGTLGTGRTLRGLAPVAMISAAGGFVAATISRAVVGALGDGVGGAAAALLAGTLVGSLVTLGAAAALRIPEITGLLGAVRRRLRPTPQTRTWFDPAVPSSQTAADASPGAASPADALASPADQEGTAVQPDSADSGSTTIGGRYQLGARSAADEDTGAGRLSTWRARDTLLSRDVLLRVHSPGGVAARGFLDRALAAGVLSHPSLAMVYDAVDENRRAYVVSEWVEGVSLAETLAAGAMDPDEARETIRRVAEGVAQAHQMGLAVGGLTPDRVILTDGGGVTVSAIPSPQASTDADVRALGALLFATLSGGWPQTADPVALRGQLDAATPPDLAELAISALSVPAGADAGTVAQDMVATLLAGRGTFAESGLSLFSAGYDDTFDTDGFLVVTDTEGFAVVDHSEPETNPTGYAATGERTRAMPVLPPLPPPAGTVPAGSGAGPAVADPALPARSMRGPADAGPAVVSPAVAVPAAAGPVVVRPAGTRPVEPGRRRTPVLLGTLVAALLVIALLVWLFASTINGGVDKIARDTGRTGGATSTTTAAATTATTTPSAAPAGPLAVTGATVFDPQGDGASENGDRAGQAYDGDPATDWPTLQYRNTASFGNLKDGVGLLFDLGSAVSVNAVDISTALPGSTVEIRAGTAPDGDLEAYPVVGQATLQDTTTIAIAGAAPARYWLVWITQLVPTDGNFAASLAEVAFTGA